MKTRKKHVEILDTKGLKCPEPLLKIAVKSVDMNEGDILEVIGDCPTFANDVKIWCKRLHKTLLFTKNNGKNMMKCQIQF
jgi:TusA-related sulfurtransferase